MAQSGNSSSAAVLPPLKKSIVRLPLKPSGVGSGTNATRSTTTLLQTSSTTTFFQLIGDEGLNGPGCPQDPTHCHDVGQRFILAAANDATNLTQSGSNVVIPVRVSSVQDVAAALTNNGPITGSVTYYGHGAQRQQGDGSFLSLLAAGQGAGQDTNVSALNVADLSNAQLSNNTSIVLKTCHAGLPPISGGGHSIAQLLANQLNRGVYAWKVGFFFSHNPNATTPNGMPSQNQPMYFFPTGGKNIAACAFLPNQPEPQHCGGEK